MPTRNVVLTDHQAELIDRLVASGRYQNASEAVRAGIRMLEEEEEFRSALTARIDAALADYEQNGTTGESAEDAVRRIFSEARSESRANSGHDAA